MNRCICLSLWLLAFASSRADCALFQPLGYLPDLGFTSQASDVSADGAAVIGTSMFPTGNQLFRWTEETGMQRLGPLIPSPSWGSTAEGISEDGSVVVGTGNGRAYRWTSDGGMVGLSGLSALVGSEGLAVSADGSVVVGGMGDLPREAFRWTSATGPVRLGFLKAAHDYSSAGAVSADGSVIAGLSSSPSQREAFRWTARTGMIGLGDLSGGEYTSVATAISADGGVIVGWSASSSGEQAFRWTQAAGMVGLGDLPGLGFQSKACDTTADGSVVVGYSINGAFIWDAAGRMQSLKKVLTDVYDIDLSDWYLIEATGISDDGSVIVGTGINPHGHTEAWRFVVPEPATLSLMGLGFACLLRRGAMK
jgi:probable HAF family extracellular repeat protein